MILAQRELRKAVEEQKVVFNPPLEDVQWGEASVDLRLGYSFTCYKSKDELRGITFSTAEGLRGLGNIGISTTEILKETNAFGKRSTFQLAPEEFVLAVTLEEITVPRDMIARVEGRSTYARLGMSIHETAPWLQPGWTGPIILEIKNSGPLTLELTPRLDRPCQLTFFRLTSELPEDVAYGGKPTDLYQNQDHPLKPKRSS
jgi:dCTP deaminase